MQGPQLLQFAIMLVRRGTAADALALRLMLDGADVRRAL